jgi:hypothetical protein
MLIEKQMRQQTVWQKELQVHLIVGFIGILKSSIQSGVVAGARQFCYVAVCLGN